MLVLALECAVRAALIAAATGGVLIALRLKSARARHTAWSAVVLWMITLPAWIAWAPKASLQVLPAGEPLVVQTVTVAQVPAAHAARPPAHALISNANWNWETGILAVYLLGVLILGARIAAGVVSARTLLRIASPRENWLVSEACAAPVTVGWFRPRIVLPRESADWPAAQLAAVLAHEQEHARSLDGMIQLCALVNRAIFWFHPLAWWLERRISALAEEACDAAVVTAGCDPHEYSRYLLDIARAVERSGARIHVLGMAMPGSALPDRLRRIVCSRPAPSASRLRATCAAISCLLLSAMLADAALAHVPPRIVRLPPVAAAVRETPPLPRPAPPKPAAPRPPQQAQASQTGRMMVLYFQLPVMDSEERQRAIAAGRTFVNTRLQSGDRVAIMTCCAVRVLQDFTSDPAVLLRALDAVPGAGAAQQSAGTPQEELRMAADLLSGVKEKKAIVYFVKPSPISTRDLQPLIDAGIRANIAFYFVDTGIDSRGTVPK